MSSEESSENKDPELDFLFGLLKDGIELDQFSLSKLQKNGYIEGDATTEEADESFLDELPPEVNTEGGDFEELNFDLDFEGPIEKKDWVPRSTTEHTKKFIKWIDSINSGFQNMIKYEPFLKYCQQAQDWLDERTVMTDMATRGEKIEFIEQELDRMAANTLYALDKYLYVSEGDEEGGKMKYISKPVHKVMCFLIDCGYSFMMGKPRQIAATTTLGGCAVFRSILRKNYFIKFVAQNDEKVEEIFGDKMKNAFYELESWMKPTVSNDRDGLLKFGRKKKKKGDSGGHNSSIKVQSPTVDAINGGAPNAVFVDEAGYIPVLTKMIKEARPTLFMRDKKTGELKLKRQIVIWGTGGEMDKAGKAYEEEFMALYDAWQNGDTSSGMIPVFFDWTTRPGMTQQFYDQEHKNYIAGLKGDRTSAMGYEERMVQFRQHYPSVVEDMFLTDQKTLLPITKINQRLSDIKNIPHSKRPVEGFFEPIYDLSRPEDEESEIPYKVKGARFIPTEDGDPRASVVIYKHPDPNWRERYVQGTDPIQSDNGYSKMASVVMDRKLMTVAACLNYRNENHKETFLQNMLLGLYYDQDVKKRGIHELVESNVGMAYFDFKDTKGFRHSLMYRTQLPVQFRGGTNIEGFDNRGVRKKAMVDKLYELFHYYGDRIHIPQIWTQLRTFICEFSEAGQEKWGVKDHRKYRDDLVDACGIAYIAHLSLDHYTPKEVGDNKQLDYRIKYKLKRVNGKLQRYPVQHKV